MGRGVSKTVCTFVKEFVLDEIERLKSAFSIELSKSSFRQRGRLYEGILDWFKEEQDQYKSWLRSWVELELSERMRNLLYLDPAVEFYEEEDFAELWSLDFYTQEHQFSIPIHWLREDLEDALNRDWGEEIANMRTLLAQHNIQLDEHLWEILRKIEWLVNTDLILWSAQVWRFEQAEQD